MSGVFLILLACAPEVAPDSGEAVHIDVPEHNECLPVGEIDRWSLSVLGGWTDEPDQTLPTDDMERLRALLEREMARRQGD